MHNKAVGYRLTAFFVYMSAFLFRFLRLNLCEKAMSAIYTLQSSQIVYVTMRLIKVVIVTIGN